MYTMMYSLEGEQANLCVVLFEFLISILDHYCTRKLVNKLEKWFPLRGERAHSLKLFCMYDKRFKISKTK